MRLELDVGEGPRRIRLPQPVEVEADAAAHAAGRGAAVTERAGDRAVSPARTAPRPALRRRPCRHDAHHVAIDEPESRASASARWSALPQTCLLNGLGHSCSQALLATLPSNTDGSGASVRTKPVGARRRDLRQLRRRQRLFSASAVGDHAVLQRLPPPLLEIPARRAIGAMCAHDIVGGRVEPPPRMRADHGRCAYRRAAGSAAGRCLRCRPSHGYPTSFRAHATTANARCSARAVSSR